MELSRLEKEMLRCVIQAGYEPCIKEGKIWLKYRDEVIGYLEDDDLKYATQGEEHYEKAVRLFAEVKEYIYALENPIQIPYDIDIPDNHHVIGATNEALLTIFEKADGYTFYVWDYSYTHKSLINCSVFGKEFRQAKEEFAERAGLIDRRKILTDDQLQRILISLDNSQNQHETQDIKQQISAYFSDYKQQETMAFEENDLKIGY